MLLASALVIGAGGLVFIAALAGFITGWILRGYQEEA
jgi:hypothetical protein